MGDKPSVLILGGTADARRLANTLVEIYGDGIRVITSLAGRTASPRLPDGEVRHGGFGGADGLAEYLIDAHVDLVVDATHPYAAQISEHAHAAAVRTGVPRLMLVRPAWTEEEGDRWTRVPDVAAAATEITRASKACLITTGINDLAKFAGIRTTKLFVRLIEKPTDPLPLPDAEVVMGRPPYRKNDEVTLMRLLSIDLIVTKNAGGTGTYAKIEAARELGLNVIVINRPQLPAGTVVESVEEAVASFNRLFGGIDR